MCFNVSISLVVTEKDRKILMLGNGEA